MTWGDTVVKAKVRSVCDFGDRTYGRSRGTRRTREEAPRIRNYRQPQDMNSDHFRCVLRQSRDACISFISPALWPFFHRNLRLVTAQRTERSSLHVEHEVKRSVRGQISSFPSWKSTMDLCGPFWSRTWKLEGVKYHLSLKKYSGSLFLLSEPFQILLRPDNFLASSTKKQQLWIIHENYGLEIDILFTSNLSNHSSIYQGHPTRK